MSGNNGRGSGEHDAKGAGNSVGPLELPDNLFDLLKENSPVVIARAALIALPTSGESAKAYLESTLRASFGERELSGVQLLAKQSVLLCVEGPSDMLHEFITRFRTDLVGKKAPFSEVKLCALSDDVPSREFRGWTVASVVVPREANVTLPEDQVTGLVAEVYLKCIALGARMAETGKGPDDLKTKHANLFLSNERLVALAKHEEIMSLDDYAGLFAEPFEDTSVADEVWPLQRLTEDLHGW